MEWWSPSSPGAEPSEVLATGRNTDALADLAGRGVRTHRLDFSDVDPSVFSEGDVVLLVSGSEPAGRPAPRRRRGRRGREGRADRLHQCPGRRRHDAGAGPRAEALVGFGLDEGTAGFVVALDHNIAEGLLGVTTGELAALLGRPTTPLGETVATWA